MEIYSINYTMGKIAERKERIALTQKEDEPAPEFKYTMNGISDTSAKQILLEDTNLWVQSEEGAISMYSTASMSWHNIGNPPGFVNPRCMELTSSLVSIGFEDGIYVYDRLTKTWQLLGALDGLNVKNVTQVKEDGDLLWLGTQSSKYWQGGILLHDTVKEKSTTFTTQEGLAGNDVTSIFISDKDKIIEEIDVPDKTKNKMAPPLHMRHEDVWGNSALSKPGPGQMFNRRTSSWYLPYQKMMVQTKRALVYFMMGEKEKAIEDIKIILEVDGREKMSFEGGLPNAYSRLLHEFQQGRLFATEKELSSFQGKEKIAIMLADYYYEMEQWEEAGKRYRRIDREMRNVLSLQAQAYLDFMLANIAFIAEDNNEKALKYLSEFHSYYKSTPTWPRAMLAYFNIYQTMEGKEKEAMESLQAIFKRMPETKWGKEAYYHTGEYLYGKGKLKEARKIFEDCKKKFKGTWLARGASQYLEMIEDKEKKS